MFVTMLDVKMKMYDAMKNMTKDYRSLQLLSRETFKPWKKHTGRVNWKSSVLSHENCIVPCERLTGHFNCSHARLSNLGSIYADWISSYTAHFFYKHCTKPSATGTGRTHSRNRLLLMFSKLILSLTVSKSIGGGPLGVTVHGWTHAAGVIRLKSLVDWVVSTVSCFSGAFKCWPPGTLVSSNHSRQCCSNSFFKKKSVVPTATC